MYSVIVLWRRDNVNANRVNIILMNIHVECVTTKQTTLLCYSYTLYISKQSMEKQTIAKVLRSHLHRAAI